MLQFQWATTAGGDSENLNVEFESSDFLVNYLFVGWTLNQHERTDS